MKIAVLNFLKKEHPTKLARFNEALQLLMQTNNASAMLQRNYNTRGFTEKSLESLEYDLKKLHGISDADIRQHIVEVPAEQEAETSAPALDQNLFLAANKDAFSNVLKDMNDEEKAGFKISERYPFLRLEDCPNEFKILTADAITAFHNFKDAHTKLFEEVVMPEKQELTYDEIYTIASQLLEDFEINREIHKELEHYATTGEILAEHDIFEGLRKDREIAALSDIQLKQKITNLASQISKKKKAVETEKDKAKKEELEASKLALENEKAYLTEKLKEREAKPEDLEEK